MVSSKINTKKIKPVQDPIANLISCITTHIMAKKNVLTVLSSNILANISKVLKEEGYINDYSITKDGNKSYLTLTLKYKNGISPITKIIQISKPGLKIYSNKEDLPHVINGKGIAIISTNKGIITDHDARKFNVGGEIIAKVW